MSKDKRMNNKLYNIGILILKGFIIAVMLFLTYYSVRFSVDVLPTGLERNTVTKDILPLNLLVILLFGGFCRLISYFEKKIKSRTAGIIAYICCFIATAAVLIEGMWWINVVDHAPGGDQLYVYAFTSYMMDGQYSYLEPTNYFGMYPHQLGLAFIMKILFTFTGQFNYHAYQTINVLFSAGTVIAGFFLVNEFDRKFVSKIIYCMSMTLCVPLIGYTQWVYGETASVFFLFLAALFITKCSKEFKIAYALISIASTAVACLYRKNSIIFLVALVIVFIMKFLKELNYRYLIAATIAIILPIVLYKGIYLYYENASNIKLDKGLPTVSWIAMGLEDNSELGPGGYTNIVETYKNTNYDLEVLTYTSKSEIKERLDLFVHNPLYSADFFKRKITMYWNQPTYQAVYYGKDANPEDTATDKMFNEVVFGNGYKFLFEYSNLLHGIVFTGTFLFGIFAVTKKRDIAFYVFPITIIGGFLFSLFWEGKGRYIFPYYMMMFPLFAVGFEECVGFIRGFFKDKFTKRKDTND